MGHPLARGIVGCLSSVARPGSRRGTSQLGVSAWSACARGYILEKAFENCHFVPLFEPFGVTSGWRHSIGKSFPVRQIGHASWCSCCVTGPRGTKHPEECHIADQPIFTDSNQCHTPIGGMFWRPKVRRRARQPVGGTRTAGRMSRLIVTRI
jgi:hypothetical protein